MSKPLEGGEFQDVGATGSPLRFGVFLPQVKMSYDVILERTLAAEDMGFDSVWIMDHLMAPAAPTLDTLEGWTLAAALAASTSRIRLGHLVNCDGFRHPALLAKMAATLDVISGGRLDLGIGWGSVPAELDAFGFPELTPGERAERLAETLEVLEKMFAGELFDFEGPHVALKGAIGRPRPIQDHVPIHIGGAGPKLTMPLVREFADWWNCPSYAVERFEQLLPLAGNAHISVQHPIGLALNDAGADEVFTAAEKRFGSWGGLICGRPSAIADALVAEARLGAEMFICQFSDFGRPESLHAFASEVIPAVREQLEEEPSRK